MSRTGYEGKLHGKQKKQPEAAFLSKRLKLACCDGGFEPTEPNFWRNFSTRPAVSTILCLPV
jgi:hypothetical protein